MAADPFPVAAAPPNAERLRAGFLWGFVGVLALLLLVNFLSYGLMAQARIADLPDPSMAGLMEEQVGAWGATFISIGLIISLLGALIAWVLLCA